MFLRKQAEISELSLEILLVYENYHQKPKLGNTEVNYR